MTIQPTPTHDPNAPLRVHGFFTVTQALDYAALGSTGVNFYSIRGEISASVSYGALRSRALALASKLAGRFERGSRICLVAETSPDFMAAFYACQYAGILPAPMPMPVNLGGKEGYLQQVRLMAKGADAAALIGPAALSDFLREAVAGARGIDILDYETLDGLPASPAAPRAFGPDEQCYIQYSSGSTSAPKGVIGTQASVCANLQGITAHGLRLRETDRAASWLPLYHDMGLIGFMLAPMYAQRSVDYLATSDFVRRPLLWLRLISENRATVTYSPSFGYDLAAKRASRADDAALDLSQLRVAGIGGDMVRPEALNLFTEAFASAGFRAEAFLPSYGMAEATLAVTFTALDGSVRVDDVDMRHYTRSSVAKPASAITQPEHKRGFVLCGKPLPGHDIEVRSDAGEPLGERAVGRIFIKGPSLTPGYFSDSAATAAMYHGDWLDTGDMGYMLDGEIVITGRAKDLIIINGRNIWPQDIEWAVEKVDGVRQGGVAAFSIDDGAGERIVVVVERRGMEAEARHELQREIARVVQNAAGAPADIVLARPHSMVMTSSGKLARAKVKAKYLEGAFEEAATDALRVFAEARV